MDASPRRTPGWLMRGGLLEPWGPPIDPPITDVAIELVRVRLSLRESRIIELLRQWPERYVLLRRISHTAAGAVYEALDRGLDRLVAIKVHRDSAQGDDEESDAWARARFEAHVAAAAQSPQVIVVHDLDRWNGMIYSVLELADMDLAAWCPGQRWREILARIIDAGRGLASVHRAGYVHNDIKPTNILVCGGTAKIADFGVATTQYPRRRLRGGTAGYTPVSAAQHGPTPADDVYALAVTTWECLFGAMPFAEPPAGDTSETFVHFVQRAAERDFVAPTLPRGMPRTIVGLLQRAMSPERAERPSLADFIRELKWTHEHPVGWRRVTAAMLPGGKPSWVNLGVLAMLLLTSAWTGSNCSSRPTSSLFDACLSSQPPLLRAEIAAKVGDGPTAIAILNGEYKGKSGPPPSDETIAAVTRVAENLRLSGEDDAADVAWYFVQRLNELRDLASMDRSDQNK
jgi:serine/threonine protein kinase